MIAKYTYLLKSEGESVENIANQNVGLLLVRGGGLPGLLHVGAVVLGLLHVGHNSIIRYRIGYFA